MHTSIQTQNQQKNNEEASLPLPEMLGKGPRELMHTKHIGTQNQQTKL
jgi:hypothetical protein